MFEPVSSMDVYHEYIANYELLVAFILLVAFLLMLWIVPANEKRKTARVWRMPLSVRGIVLIGAVVRFPLFFRPFWYDETFTSSIVQSSNFFTAVAGDVHPPLYYGIVWMAAQILGHSEWAMRLPAFVSGLLIIPVMYSIGKWHHGGNIGRWFALLVALLPTTIYYSVEARYPMMLVLMLALSYRGLQTRRAWLVVVPLAVANLLHVNAWFYTVSFLLMFFIQRGWRCVPYALLPSATIVAWLPVALNQAQDVANGFWLPQYSAYMFAVEMTIGSRFVNHALAFPMQGAFMLVVLVAFVMYRWKATRLWLVALVLPATFQYLVGVVWHPIYLPRTLIFSGLLLMLPVAIWIAHYRLKVLFALFAISMVVGIINLITIPLEGRFIDDVLAYCDGYDAIYVTSTHNGIMINHFADKPVFVYSNGDNIAQTLPLESKQSIFAGVTDLRIIDRSRFCLIGVVSMWNEQNEIDHLNTLAPLATNIERYQVPKNSAYYVIMTFDGMR